MSDPNDEYLNLIAKTLDCHRAYIVETIEQLQLRVGELEEFEFIYKGEQK